MIDEIQRAPLLLSYIQIEIDENRLRKGRYIFTGSYQTELRSAVSQSLAGRTAIVYLLPLSLAELGSAGISLERDEYLFTGFMPQLYQEKLSPTSMYSQYYRTYIERDIRQLANIRNMSQFETFTRLLAGRIAQVLNMSDLANSTGISVTTIREWVNMLESSFIIFRLPPYFENFGKRLIKSPKIYFSEPGLAAYLLGIREPAHVGYGPFLGALFENMVVVEALKAIYNRAEDANIYFYRDNNGLEADMLIDFYRYLYPVKIKASQTFSPDFAKSIFRLHKVAPKIQSGAVVYAGNLETAYKGIHLTHFSHTQALFS